MRNSLHGRQAILYDSVLSPKEFSHMTAYCHQKKNLVIISLFVVVVVVVVVVVFFFSFPSCITGVHHLRRDFLRM